MAGGRASNSSGVRIKVSDIASGDTAVGVCSDEVEEEGEAEEDVMDRSDDEEVDVIDEATDGCDGRDKRSRPAVAIEVPLATAAE